MKRCVYCHKYRTLNDIAECHECEQSRLEREQELTETEDNEVSE